MTHLQRLAAAAVAALLIGLTPAASVNADANETSTTSTNYSVQSSITYGNTQACLVLADKTVKCWGSNFAGQLGDGTTTNSLNPVFVKTSASNSSPLANVTSASAGHNHVCAVLADKTAWCWGENGPGALGDGTTTDRSTPVQVLASGTQASSPVPLADVVAISAGTSHTCAILLDTTVRCWGEGGQGALGDGTPMDRSNPVRALLSGTEATSPVPLTGVVSISAGPNHTCAVLSDKTAWCWGNNAEGALGDGTTTNRLNPVQVLASGTQTASPVPLTDVVAISADSYYTCAVLGDGTAKCWGSNQYGRLGIGADFGTGTGQVQSASNPTTVTGLTGVTAISAGELHVCALKSAGTVLCWGLFEFGDLTSSVTLNGSEPKYTAPSQVTGLSSVVAVSTGRIQSGVLTAAGIKTLGFDNDSPPAWDPADVPGFVPADIPSPGDGGGGGSSGGGGGSSGGGGGSSGGGGAINESANTDPGNGGSSPTTTPPNNDGINATVDDKTVPLDTDTTDDGRRIIKGPDFTLEFDEQNDSPENELLISKDDDTTIRGRGFAPNSDISVSLLPSGGQSDSFKSNKKGGFTSQFAVQPNTRPGIYEMRIEGTSATGGKLVISLNVRVVRGSSSLEVLPSTGDHAQVILPLGLLLTLFGALVFSRRRLRYEL